MVSPFVYDPAARLLGFQEGAKTNLKRYLEMSQLVGGSDERSHGASYNMSIYWQFVGHGIFYNPVFVS